MKAFVLYNSYSHIPEIHQRQEWKKRIVRKLLKADNKEELFLRVYKLNCSEMYCYPKAGHRFLSKRLCSEFAEWEKAGGLALYAQYNKMD